MRLGAGGLRIERLLKFEVGGHAEIPGLPERVVWVLMIGNDEQLFLTPVTTTQLTDPRELERTLLRRDFLVNLPKRPRFEAELRRLLDHVVTFTCEDFPFHRGRRAAKSLTPTRKWTPGWVAEVQDKKRR